MGYPMGQSIRSYQALSNDTLKSKIGLKPRGVGPKGIFMSILMPSQDQKSELYKKCEKAT